MALGRGKRCPAFWDLACGRNGCFLGTEETNDPKYMNVLWQEVNSMSPQIILNVPIGSIKLLDPSECPKMYKHGIVILVAGEGGEAPLRGIIQKEFSTIILALQQKIERLSGKATASEIREKRTTQDFKSALKEHAEIKTIIGDRQQEEGSSPFLRRPRMEEE